MAAPSKFSKTWGAALAFAGRLRLRARAWLRRGAAAKPVLKVTFATGTFGHVFGHDPALKGIAALAHDKLLSLYVAAGFTPSFVTLQAIPGNQASMLSVASGEAICFALAGPLSRSYQAVSGVEVVPLDEPGAELSVQMAWRTNEVSPLVCEFLRAAREVFAATDDSTGHRFQPRAARSR